MFCRHDAQEASSLRRKRFVSSMLREKANYCLLYTSDAADDMQCVDLGGRRIIKKWVVLGVVVDCGG